MAAELPRPGVEVIQQFKSATPTITRPTLVPFVAGPAKEVIEVTTADGTLNTQAKQGVYSQLPKTVTQSAFPSPRGNILEVNVEEETIRVFMLIGGILQELERDPGESFLTAHNYAMGAAIQTLPITSGGLALDGLTLVLAIDVAARLDTSKDVAITFAADSPGGNLTAQQVADQIDLALGSALCSLVPVSADNRVQVTSSLRGAASSVTIRAGGSANTLLGFDDAVETRVEGSGFRAQDLNNNTTLSPWVEFYKGGYLLDGVAQSSFPAITALTPGYGLVDTDDTFAGTFATTITFTGVGSIDLRKGDEFFADGVAPNSARVMVVEATRFKLGTINAQLSTFTDTGKLVSAIFDPSNVNTLFSSAAFAPTFAYFRAKNLSVSAVPQPAILTGTTEGAPAEVAFVESTSAPTGPFSLTGLTLRIALTVNGVEQDEQVMTFTGAPLADMDAVVAAINAAVTAETLHDLAASNDAGMLVLSTTRTGATQAINLKSTSTALSTLGFPTGNDITDTGKDVEFVDIAAALLTVADITFPLTLGGAGETLVIDKSVDGGTTYPSSATHTFSTAGPFADMAALLAELTSGTSWGGAGPTAVGLAISAVSNKLLIKSVATGSLIALKVNAGSTSIGSGASDIRYTSGQSDVGEENLNGQTLQFKVNRRPKVYSVLFTNDSLVDAVEAINTAFGFPVASIGGDNENELTLTSDLVGQASYLEVLDNSTTAKAIAALGFGSGNQTASGTGRPNPDFYLDSFGSVVLGADILRNQVTGTPLNPGDADTYIQYTGLRLDLSPMAAKPGLLQLSDTSTLQSVLNPINQNNPLGLGMFFAMINAPGLVCTGMGVDAITAAEPFGTPQAYSRVCSFIESEEVYAMAPLTHSETVGGIFNTHALFMSQGAQKGERITFINPLYPSRDVNNVVASGLNGNSTATENEFVLDSNPSAALLTNGINPALPVALSKDLFVELLVATSSGSELRNYSVSSLNGVVVEFRTTFADDENLDGFYSTTPLTESLVNADWTMAIRGGKLLIPGSTLPDKEAIAATVQKKGQVYKQRRLFYVFPDTAIASLGGTEEQLPGFYMCAAIAGMVGFYPPQQGFTNLPMTGFTGVRGSNDTHSNHQLNVMAAGGIYIVVQDAPGGPLTSRHQLSTDLTSIEKRELSITKVVDFTAKFLRTGLRNFIGTFNITQAFLDSLSTAIHGMGQFLIETGVLLGFEINNIIQSKDQPDTVLVDVTLSVPYPCNYIRLTLVI